MGGVVIGSTMLEQFKKNERIIALTVNDHCQCECPHCYLKTGNAGKKIISREVIGKMWGMNPASVAVIGKEPLFNKESRKIMAEIILHGQALGIPVSMITNGMNLRAFANEEMNALKELRHIDVSLDATTQEHYTLCRPGGMLADAIDGMKAAQDCGVDVRLLHIIDSMTLPWIEETAAKSRELTSGIVMFSPLIETERAAGGHYTVKEVPLDEIIGALKSASSFMSNSKAVILFDPYHCEFTGESMKEVKRAGAQLGSHLAIVEQTPEALGIVRLTYDGFIMSPRLALDTARYPSLAMQK